MLNLAADFRSRFWALVRLRYRLLWAHARTSNGRLTLLFALYLLSGLLTLVLALGGLSLGAALAKADAEQAQFLARWLLAGLFANGIGLSLLFGAGARAAFSEDALRRFPLNARERFIVRQVIGLFDPVWLLLGAATFGLAFGFVWLGNGSWLRSLVAATIFITANYLATIVLLTLIGWAMETRTGRRVLGASALLAVSFGPLVISVFAKNPRHTMMKLLDPLLRFTPPGAAAGLIAGDNAATVFNSFLLLLSWSVALAGVLQKLETRPRAARTTAAGNLIWHDLYDQLSNLCGAPHAPLVNKALRYHLRCNMVRFSLFSAPLVVLASKYFLPRQNPYGAFFMALGIFFIMSSATAAIMTLNTFGYDAAGIRRYAVLPVPFVTALRAGNLTSLLLRSAVVLVSLALWLVFNWDLMLNWQMPVMLAGTALAGLFLYNALGFWTSVLAPKSMDFEALWNNRLSLGANVVLIGTMILPFWGAMMLAHRAEETIVKSYWWLPLLALIVCAAFYALSFQMIERLLRARRERLINLIAGARDK